MADIISGIAGPALQFGGSLMNNLFGRSAQKKALKQQWRMYEDMKEWNKPVNQMARLQEAGLNPNLVYGSLSGGGAGNVNSTPNVGEPVWGGAVDVGALGDIPEKILDFKQKKIYNEIVKNQLEGSKLNLDIQREIMLKTKAEAGYIAAQTHDVLNNSALKNFEINHYMNNGYDKNTNWFVRTTNYLTGKGQKAVNSRTEKQRALKEEETRRLYEENEAFLKRYGLQ